jgi:hypothetical protein
MWVSFDHWVDNADFCLMGIIKDSKGGSLFVYLSDFSTEEPLKGKSTLAIYQFLEGY